MTQIPHGPDNLYCPLWRDRMSKRCHTCPMWTQVRGKSPQSDTEVDRWDCSLALMPLLMVENSQQMRQAGASTDKVATEVSKFRKSMEHANALHLGGVDDDAAAMHLLGKS